MINEDVIARVARLSRIALSPDERAHFAREVSGIIQWIEQLGEVDTAGVAPMASVSDVALPWRADTVTDGAQAEAVLANAPAKNYGCFEVPSVME